MPETLPWQPGTVPLMLAPMQGLTNHVLRQVFYDWVAPDVLWTEFVRVGPKASKTVSKADQREIAAVPAGAHLVVQLVGHSAELLTAAAQKAIALGATQINLNLGCPYGRMNRGASGGALLQQPDQALSLVQALRDVIEVGFSVKLRAGYEDPRQIFDLVPALERIGVDFLVLHPRTVVQEYQGRADHRITADVVASTRLPVIANGDIDSVSTAQTLLQQTGAAGLMLGRHALTDPLLFQRIRQQDLSEPSDTERLATLGQLLQRLIPPYAALFCGEVQTLHKLKNVFALNQRPSLEPALKRLKKARTLAQFRQEIVRLTD